MRQLLTYKVIPISIVYLFLSLSISAQNAVDSLITDTIMITEIDIEDIPATKESNKKKIIEEWDQKKEKIVSSLFGEPKTLSNADSIMQVMDKLPSFGIYKDNFFVIGTEMFKRPSAWNSDAKFQISVRQRITNSTLPFKTYLYFTYTQKAFWDVFRDSFPFRDLNYNPGIGLGRTLTFQNRLLGSIGLMFEHESNGKDGIDSRSWNKITFSTSLILHRYWLLEVEAWIPFVDGEENADIVKYMGWSSTNIEYTSPNKKFVFGANFVKRGGVNLNFNVTLSAAIRLYNNSNQFLYAEIYNGYGESMLDYKEFRQRFRVGFVIKPKFLNMY